jgi:SAM-dependent methyltransferase
VNIRYLILRTIRHFLPESLTRTLLRSGIVIKPGLETREPHQAALRYQLTLQEKGISLEGKHLLVFGYGGRFAIGIELLRLGASHVTLTDLFAPPDDKRNDYLLPDYAQYLQRVNGVVRPRNEFITLLHGDIRVTASGLAKSPLDGVVSTSVYEHLDDVDGITRALHSVLKPGGFFIAYVDLRDHYFKYPFEMLSYSDKVWTRWLNPTSNLNRFRMRDYQRVIGTYFPRAEYLVTERDAGNFHLAKDRIRPEFLTGDEQLDAVTQIRVMAIN